MKLLHRLLTDERESHDAHSRSLDDARRIVEKTGIPEEILRAQSLITPSCGTGSLSIEDAMKAFSLLKGLRNSYVKG